MHTISEMGTSVPAFLGKLWRLVEDPETDDLICWSPSGRSFFIRNQAQFARELLPHYYKHNNMASFVRQLNMYGFHKKVSVELGGLKCDRDEMEFAHQYFCKDHPYLLEHIKRKIASNKTQDPSQAPMKPELMNRMLTEVRSMRGRQEHFDSRLGAMKRENEALWRELALLRQKHHKQQQIVNKLIHFLVSLVQPNRNTGLAMKRRYPLMIDASRHQRNKQSKMSKANSSPGPAIHELDSSEPDLDSDYIVAEMLDADQGPMIESPEHQSAAEDNMSEYYIDEPVQIPQELSHNENTTVTKKRFKGKKKGEETLMLEVPTSKKSQPQASSSSSTSKTTETTKPIPIAPLRSSKLAAMAANMKKNQQSEVDLGLDLEDSSNSNSQKDESLIKLENILIVPDVMNENYGSPEAENNHRTSSVSSLSAASASPENNSSEMLDGSFGNFDLEAALLANQEKQQQLQQQQQPSNSKNNMSLRCVNTGNNNPTSEANYRLASMEEVDTHLDSMQSELENLREILRGEGYSIDANTLLGVSNFKLFGAEDPMSFGIPVNPDLDPHSNLDRDDDNNLSVDQSDSVNKEIMSYSHTPSLLDFDDDIFLGASSSSPTSTSIDINSGINPDPLELADNKGNLLDSLIAANAQSSQT